MRLLTLVDQVFLLLDNKKQPMHMGGVFIFEVPKNKDDFVTTLVRQMQHSSILPTPPFNQILHNLAFWKVDNDFDIKHHLRHIALTGSMQLQDLLTYVSKQHEQALDKDRPLWECHIIEGLQPEHANAPKRFGVYFKIHHALLDGVAAMRLIQKSLSPSPDEIVTQPVWALMSRNPNHLNILHPARQPIRTLIKGQFHAVKPAYQELKKGFLNRKNPSYISSTQAPACILNQRISNSRQIIANSYDISRFKKISAFFGVSINDVALALCSGALRQYLLSLDKLPSDPLIACVPTSLREDDSATGNQLAFILCNLGTHLSKPHKRLQTIHDSMQNGKRRFADMSQQEFINYSIMAYGWEGVNLLTNIYPEKKAFNVVISNIIGSTEPLYWNGAKLTALYPASIILDGLALNITLAGYVDHIEFGITACTKTLPNIHIFVDLLEDELTAFESLVTSA